MKRLLLVVLLFLPLPAHATPDTAVRFDGVNDTATVENGSGWFANTTALTLEGWVLPENTNPTFPDFDGFFGIRDNSVADFYVLQLNNSNELEGRFRNSAGTAFTIGASGTSLQANRWNHIALTYDGANLRLYVNGRQAGSTAANGQITLATEPFKVAHLPFGANNFEFRGAVDEIRVWRSARSETEVRDHMYRNLTGAEANLAAYFRFDHLPGTDSAFPTTGDTLMLIRNADANTIWVASTAPIGDSNVQLDTGLRAVSFAEPVSTLSGGLQLRAAAIADTLNYAVFGHDNTSGTTTLEGPAGYDTSFLRLVRRWHVDVTGAVTADLIFDLSNVPGDTLGRLGASNYLLLTRSSSSGNFSLVAAGASNVRNDSVTFSGVALVDSNQYTIARVNDTPRLFVQPDSAQAAARIGETIVLVVSDTMATDSDVSDTFGSLVISVEDTDLVSASISFTATRATITFTVLGSAAGTDTVSIRVRDRAGAGETKAFVVNLVPSDSPSVRILLANPTDTTQTRFNVRVAIDTATAGDSVRLVVNGVIQETRTITATAETVTLGCTLTAQANTVAAQYIRRSDGTVFADTISIRIDTARVAIRLPNPTETTAVTFTLQVAVDSGIIGDSVRLVVNGATVDSRALTATSETVTLTCTLSASSNIVAARYVRSLDSTVIADTITILTGPTSLTLVDSAQFLLATGSFASDSGRVRVRDALGNNVANAAVVYTIVASPTGATGHSLDTSVSDSSGISRVNLRAGNVAGVYIVRAQLPGIAPVYFGFHTNEYDLPAATWRMIALDRSPADPRLAGALAGLTPSHIFRWNPEAPSHSRNLRYEVPANLVSTEGYFLQEQSARRFTVAGGSLITDTRDVSLKKGWNLLGPPYWYVTRWNAARIVSGGTEMTLDAAQSAGIIQNQIYWFKDNAYQSGPNSANTDPILTPWNGFWIKAQSDATLRLSSGFYYSETTAPLVSAQALGLVAGKAADNWKVKLTVNGGGGAQTTSFFGVSPGASDGGDFGLDIENPPTVVGALGTGLSGGTYSQELKAPFTSANEWLFNVTAGTNDTTIILSFSDLANLPSEFVLFLVDLGSGGIVDVRANPTYSLGVSGLSTRTFRFVAGTASAAQALLAQALDVSRTFAYPNPGPGPDGNVRFRYNTTAAGTLRLRVFDLAGRPVINRVIDLNANPTEFAWDTRNDAGKPVGTGVYLYILEFGSSTTQKRVTDKLAIVR